MRDVSTMICPHCKQATSVRVATHSIEADTALGGIRHRKVQALYEKSKTELWWIGICNYCENPVLVLNRNAEKVFPTPLPSQTDERIPEDIRNDLDEAKRCFTVNAYV